VLPNIHWTDSARDHVRRHGVSESEVEAAIWGSPRYVRRVGERATVIAGTNGRVLFVVVEESKQAGDAFEVVTAREATDGEKALLSRRGKGFR